MLEEESPLQSLIDTTALIEAARTLPILIEHSSGCSDFLVFNKSLEMESNVLSDLLL